VRPDSAFCGNCGAALSGLTSNSQSDNAREDQLTTSFAPVASPTMDTEYQPVSEPSPWASPDSAHYTPPSMYDGQTASSRDPNVTVIGAAPGVSYEPPQPVGPQGIRGFFLGVLAIILICAVLSLYLYDAWLTDSARETVESWLPWLN
jgi:hypothetical protein